MIHPQNFSILDKENNLDERQVNEELKRAEESRPTKQVIAVRRDLCMSVGKTAAQTAHASMKVFFGDGKQSLLSETVDSYAHTQWQFTFGKDSAAYQWISGIFTKIVVGVDSEIELVELYQKACEMNLPAALIKDAGKTEFKEPTITCAAFGPWWSDELNELTGHLKLL